MRRSSSYLKGSLPFESKSAFEFSDKRMSVGVIIVRKDQKMNIGTRVLSSICCEN